MGFTVLKQWETIDGGYFSSTKNYKDYDTAFGEFHDMVKPMKNDQNVAYFRLSFIDEFGSEKEKPIVWNRPQPIVEEVEEVTEVNP